MKVLVACEYSGIVRDAFRRRGHDAMSCDLLPTELPGPHYQGDVRDVLDDGWDLMVAHPPCTYLANSGVRWLTEDPERWGLMEDGAAFFRLLLDAPIPRKAVENPTMHGYGRAIVGRGPDQCIQPWQFGHHETKRTCLWLDGLWPLIPTNDVSDELADLPRSVVHRVHSLPPSPDRWKLRSTTYAGIAEAMAHQWGDLT